MNARELVAYLLRIEVYDEYISDAVDFAAEVCLFRVVFGARTR